MNSDSVAMRFYALVRNCANYYKVGVFRYPGWVIGFVVFLCSLSLYYTINNLGFDTDTVEMLSPELGFHQNRIRLWDTFPQDVKAILIVVDGPSPESAREVTRKLASQLGAESGVIESVYVPGQGSFFDEVALLYLDVEELSQLSETLSKAQPLLGRLAKRNSLDEFLSLVGRALTTDESRVGFDLKPLLSAIGQAFVDAEAGRFSAVSWQRLFAGKSTILNSTRRFLIVKAHLDYQQIFPAQKALELIRNHANDIESEIAGVDIRMTGETALQHEELESVSQGSAISAVVSLVLVCGTLFLGLRSVPLILATIVTLIGGLVLTAGFATLAVGHLNMISIAFAVLYIGLGVDYAIHLCLHFQDALNQDRGKIEALFEGIRAVAPALVLCAITSAVGFYSFIPTSYSGVSELGVISGTSMFIGLALTLTFLPALLTLANVSPLPKEAASIKKPIDFSTATLSKRNQTIRWSALFLAFASAVVLPEVTFDFDPVHLRDTGSESVSTYNDLVEDPNTSPLTISVLESDRHRAMELAGQLRQLASVEKVLSIDDFVPRDQETKLGLIEEISLILGPLPHEFAKTEKTVPIRKAYDDFLISLSEAIELRRETDLEPELITLHDRLKRFRDSVDNDDTESRILQLFERNLLENLPAMLAMLREALNAEEVRPDQLPSDLSERWLSPNGIYRIQVFPKQDITRLENLRAFVEEVQTIAPDASDLPVIYFEAGKEVVKAFQQALLTALSAIVIVLLLVFRNVRDTLYVLLPLVLAATLTAGTCVLGKLPFNFANIIAIPLLFGLGIDSGIHVMHRIRNGTYRQDIRLMNNTTSRAIVLSALTTIFSFSSLAFSAHTGTASMGILLAIGILFTLFSTLIVLPAFALRSPSLSTGIRTLSPGK